jgi:hypothetical protein
MIGWYWVLAMFFVGVGLGLFAAALCHMAADWRHERRIKSQIAGRSYWEKQ